ncbi:MAG: ATP-binding protein [Bacteroidetes bacterium]|nr:ATP-binding protein [Bacteroidota bacterium]
MPVRHTLVIPSATRYLSKVRKFISTHALNANLSDEAISELRLAVDEACSNVIEHAYQGKPNEKIHLTMTIETTRIIVQIRDRGFAFNENTYQKPNLIKLSRNRKSGGFGVDIIRRLMDQVEYHTNGEINEIKLIKRIRSHWD